jgi:ABC-type spermidine/putrescine transport system permease subunit II
MSDDAGATPTAAAAAGESSSSALRLLPLVVPGIVVGVGSALLLILVTGIANGIEDVLWSWLPAAVGMDPNAPGSGRRS